MSVQEIRDKNNKLLGKITTRSDGKLELRDANAKYKGSYDPKTNDTRDENAKFVSKGNMLSALLFN